MYSLFKRYQIPILQLVIQFSQKYGVQLILSFFLIIPITESFSFYFLVFSHLVLSLGTPNFQLKNEYYLRKIVDTFMLLSTSIKGLFSFQQAVRGSRWLSDKESAHNAGDRRCSLDPWVRKMPQKRKWQPTPVFLPEKSQEQRPLAGYSPWATKSQM